MQAVELMDQSGGGGASYLELGLLWQEVVVVLSWVRRTLRSRRFLKHSPALGSGSTCTQAMAEWFGGVQTQSLQQPANRARN
jgi:hypothetical protein